MTEPRVAAIDVGTNTVRLLIADVVANGAPALRDVERDLVITRLGEGVDASKRLRAEAIRRTVQAIAGYAQRARAAGSDRILIAGTSAVRDAANNDELGAAVLAATGTSLRILSGRQEARFAFAGAASGLDLAGGAVVCDIGGGSTELVAGDTEVRAAVSMDIGSVRLTERHIRSDPPPEDELRLVRDEARRAVTDGAAEIAIALRALGHPTLVGVAGTVTTLAAVVLDLPRYDRSAVHGTRLSLAGVVAGRSLLAAMTGAERRALPVMPPGREDVIVAGVVLLEEIMDVLGFDAVTVSESDILDGLALSLALAL